MNATLNAALKSYRDGSLAALKENVSKEKLSAILQLLTNIAKEIDDSGKADTSCHGLKSYSEAEEHVKTFLQDFLRRLKKPIDALQVIHVLERWGVMAKHENISIWNENLDSRKRHSEAVKKAAITLVETATRRPLDATSRLNFTDFVSFAIDKSNTRDVDDAISCDLTTNTVFVHIAAPAEYVQNQRYHPLMKEASRRLLSIYSCQDRFPMFPDEVASNLFSLKCGSLETRYTTTFKFQVTQDGCITPESMNIYASVISRPVCLSYRDVTDILNNPDHCHHLELKSLEKLAELRRQWRFSKGRALQYARNEKAVQNQAAHRIVDEMMISANLIAGKIASSMGIPVIYRGVSGGNRFATSNSRCNTFHGTNYSCSMYVSGTKKRDMEKGANVQLDTRPLRHVGLGLDEYVQATSPIRKFSDLIFHFQLTAIIRKQPLPFSEKYLLEMKDKIMELEQASVRIERRAKKYWAYQQLMKDGPKLHGGVIWSKATEHGKHDRSSPRIRPFKRVTCRKEQDMWIVFLKNVGCEVPASVPFRVRKGMEVKVQIDEVNPRSSHIVARVVKDLAA